MGRESVRENVSKFAQFRSETTLAMQYESYCIVAPAAFENLGIKRALVSLSCVNCTEVEMCV